MAKRSGRQRGKPGRITSILVLVVAGFCVWTSWQDKQGIEVSLPTFDAPAAFVEGALERFGELGGGEDDGEGIPTVSGSLAGAKLEVHFLDVGQGDSILIKAPDSNVLIDAGEKDQGEGVVRYLAQVGARRLDYVIATHPHADHIGGLAAAVEELQVKNIIMPTLTDDMVPTTQTYTDLLLAIADKRLTITGAKPGKTYDLGDGARLTILGPNAEYNDLNNMSLVCRLQYGETSFIFTGDAEAAAERGALDLRQAVSSDVLKVSHHGSDTSSCEEFLTAVSPRIAVVSCGIDNSYGHPHREVVERLEAANIRILRTDLSGVIVIESDGERLSVNTEK